MTGDSQHGGRRGAIWPEMVGNQSRRLGALSAMLREGTGRGQAPEVIGRPQAAAAIACRLMERGVGQQARYCIWSSPRTAPALNR